VDVVIHLAWSFSDDPVELLESDLKGHMVLLEGCSAARVSRLVYASTAVVYGKPGYAPITEDSPCLVEEARKPFYAIAKLTAEKLALAYGKMKGLPVTVFRFWWAYGDNIGGSHLRELIRKSLQGRPLEMVWGAGGAFITMKDLEAAILLAIANDRAAGQVYNVGSLFLTWEEIGRMIICLTGSCSALVMKRSEDWQGPAFLNEVWDLAWQKAAGEIGYKPEESVHAARVQFMAALGAAVARVEAEEKGAGPVSGGG
jgi:nucleoside-diphosphate-sugar epimerase